MKQLSPSEVRKVGIEILDYIVSLCDSNNLRYYLSYGTLLGAIRHRGFIPWDDDIDITMPRPDYNRLIALIKADCSSAYKALLPNEEDYYYEFAKVIDSRTKVITPNIQDIKSLGVWVDIFPMDGLAEDYLYQKKRLYCLHRARVGAVYKKIPPCPSKIQLPLYYLFWKFCRIVGYRYFLSRIITESEKHSYDECEYVGYAATIHSLNNRFSKSIFEKTINIEFEGKFYCIPTNYNEYLSSLYGDYMQQPSERARKNHEILAYWR